MCVVLFCHTRVAVAHRLSLSAARSAVRSLKNATPSVVRGILRSVRPFELRMANVSEAAWKSPTCRLRTSLHRQPVFHVDLNYGAARGGTSYP